MSAQVRQGRAVAAARDLLGWSQQEVAKAVSERGNVNIASYTLGKIERGERPATATELGEIAAVMGVPITLVLRRARVARRRNSLP